MIDSRWRAAATRSLTGCERLGINRPVPLRRWPPTVCSAVELEAAA